MKLSIVVQIKNAMGLHTRPSTELVKILQDYKAQVSLTYKKVTVNARSILGILMLALPRNAKVMLTADGEDAEKTIERLKEAFEKEFGEAGGEIYGNGI